MDRRVETELPRHRVFRVIASGAHGFLPFRPFEAAVGAAVGLTGAYLHVLVGVAAAVAAVGLLVAWRRLDGNRLDYVVVSFCRPGGRPRTLSLEPTPEHPGLGA